MDLSTLRWVSIGLRHPASLLGLQRFLGHKNIESARRYARLADNALLEVLPSRKDSQRQVLLMRIGERRQP